ncbi:MAG: hypothetical protein JO189_25070 [Deltaproteobacteria bacterium]|nr:hypothetical protein [Deltaproteobacteria bacterium]
MSGVVVKRRNVYRGADGNAKTPGVNNGMRALELIVAGVEPVPAGAPCSWISGYQAELAIIV